MTQRLDRLRTPNTLGNLIKAADWILYTNYLLITFGEITQSTISTFKTKKVSLCEKTGQFAPVNDCSNIPRGLLTYLYQEYFPTHLNEQILWANIFFFFYKLRLW